MNLNLLPCIKLRDCLCLTESKLYRYGLHDIFTQVISQTAFTKQQTLTNLCNSYQLCAIKNEMHAKNLPKIALYILMRRNYYWF